MNLKTERLRNEEAHELLDDIELIQNLINLNKTHVALYEHYGFNLVEKTKRKIRRLEAIETGLIEQYLKLINIDSK